MYCTFSASRGGKEGNGKDPKKTEVSEEKASNATVNASSDYISEGSISRINVLGQFSRSLTANLKLTG